MFQIHHTVATQGAVEDKWNALVFDIAIGTATSFGGAAVGSADYGDAAQSDLTAAEPEPEPEPEQGEAGAGVGQGLAAQVNYERSTASQVLFTAPSGALQPETPTTPYQLYHRVVGGILVRQRISKKARCNTMYEKDKIDPHTNELYFDFCHPSDDERLSCFSR